MWWSCSLAASSQRGRCRLWCQLGVELCETRCSKGLHSSEVCGCDDGIDIMTVSFTAAAHVLSLVTANAVSTTADPTLPSTSSVRTPGLPQPATFTRPATHLSPLPLLSSLLPSLLSTLLPSLFSSPLLSSPPSSPPLSSPPLSSPHPLLSPPPPLFSPFFFSSRLLCWW